MSHSLSQMLHNDHREIHQSPYQVQPRIYLCILHHIGCIALVLFEFTLTFLINADMNIPTLDE